MRTPAVPNRSEPPMLSHYFQAVLRVQFDEYIWFDEITAVQPIETHEIAGVPVPYPFGV